MACMGEQKKINCFGGKILSEKPLGIDGCDIKIDL
jgi:hypothetical protein